MNEILNISANIDNDSSKKPEQIFKMSGQRALCGYCFKNHIYESRLMTELN